MRKILLAGVMSMMVVLLCPALASAALPGLDKLGLGGTTSAAAPSVSLAALTQSKDKVTGAYAQSTQGIAAALQQIASVFGAKEEVAGQLAAVNSLKSGAVTPETMNLVRQGVEAVSGILQKKTTATQALAPMAQKSFASGLTNLVNNLQSLKGVLPEVGSLTQQAKGFLASAPLKDKMNAQGVLSSAMTLAQNIPQDLKSYKGVLSLLLQYAASRNIAVPPAAQTLLSVL